MVKITRSVKMLWKSYLEKTGLAVKYFGYSFEGVRSLGKSTLQLYSLTHIG